MADIIDQANEAADIYTRSSLSWRKHTAPSATGLCLNCDADLSDSGRRWCDTDCRDDWEKRHGKVDLPPETHRETMGGTVGRMADHIKPEAEPVPAAIAEVEREEQLDAIDSPFEDFLEVDPTVPVFYDNAE